jgi:hypothetical protein
MSTFGKLFGAARRSRCPCLAAAVPTVGRAGRGRADENPARETIAYVTEHIKTVPNVVVDAVLKAASACVRVSRSISPGRVEPRIRSRQRPPTTASHRRGGEDRRDQPRQPSRRLVPARQTGHVPIVHRGQRAERESATRSENPAPLARPFGREQPIERRGRGHVRTECVALLAADPGRHGDRVGHLGIRPGGAETETKRPPGTNLQPLLKPSAVSTARRLSSIATASDSEISGSLRHRRSRKARRSSCQLSDSGDTIGYARSRIRSGGSALRSHHRSTRLSRRANSSEFESMAVWFNAVASTGGTQTRRVQGRVHRRRG